MIYKVSKNRRFPRSKKCLLYFLNNLCRSTLLPPNLVKTPPSQTLKLLVNQPVLVLLNSRYLTNKSGQLRNSANPARDHVCHFSPARVQPAPPQEQPVAPTASEQRRQKANHDSDSDASDNLSDGDGTWCLGPDGMRHPLTEGLDYLADLQELAFGHGLLVP